MENKFRVWLETEDGAHYLDGFFSLGNDGRIYDNDGCRIEDWPEYKSHIVEFQAPITDVKKETLFDGDIIQILGIEEIKNNRYLLTLKDTEWRFIMGEQEFSVYAVY